MTGIVRTMRKVAGNLLDAGADALLVACTEFSVIGPPAGAIACR